MTAARKLGWFLGVFTPTILTILGVIMYLRFGWVLGTVGLGKTLLIVVLANAITLITTLSFSAVATNARVGVGGAYYIVSRSLGLEIGGAIGLPLFLAQVCSVTLYSFGLAESIQRLAWPGMPVAPLAAVIIVAVAALSLRGARLALAVQVPLMAAIAVSLVALSLGAFLRPAVGAPEVVAPAAGVGFWVVFAVFFPAVTGIMAGLGLSGDLADPVRAIPRGAILAVVVGFAVYLSVPFVLAFAADPAALRQDSLIWTSIAILGAPIILPGLWGAIFSSAVGSVLAAPRTLQALALDRLVPARFGRLGKRIPEPVLGTFVTMVIALLAVLLGDLNSVAAVVTMFFLATYGTLNVAAALEKLSGDPSYRPRFPLPWPVSLAGGMACMAVMFLISPVAAGAAIAVEIVLWVWLTRRRLEANFGDARRGMWESVIRTALIKLASRPQTARNWRPHLLVFADDVERRLDLVRCGCALTHDRGIVTVCELVVGSVLDEGLDLPARRSRIAEVLDREELVAFPEVDVVGDVIGGMQSVTQANGLAGLQSNTVLLGWPKEPERLAEFLEVIRRLDRLHKSAVIARVEPAWTEPEADGPRIDVWWGGLQRNGDLMLLLAHLLAQSPEMPDARIRLLSIAMDEGERAIREADLARLLADCRIEAVPCVLSLPEGRLVREMIREESAGASVTVLGLDLPAEGAALPYARSLTDLSDRLRTVLFVRNSSLFRGQLL